MNNIDLMNYQIKSADKDFVTMEILYKNKQNTQCLYIGQLIKEFHQIQLQDSIQKQDMMIIKKVLAKVVLMNILQNK